MTNEPTNTSSDDMTISGATLDAISDPMPTPADIKLHTTNVSAADKRVAMLTEMMQACAIIAQRYEDKRDETSDLRERLASAMEMLNRSVRAAFAAGLSFEQVDGASKRFGIRRTDY